MSILGSMSMGDVAVRPKRIQYLLSHNDREESAEKCISGYYYIYYITIKNPKKNIPQNIELFSTNILWGDWNKNYDKQKTCVKSTSIETRLELFLRDFLGDMKLEVERVGQNIWSVEKNNFEV